MDTLQTHTIAKTIAAASSHWAYRDVRDPDGNLDWFATLASVPSEEGEPENICRVNVNRDNRISIEACFSFHDREAEQSARASYGYKMDGTPDRPSKTFALDRIEAVAKTLDRELPAFSAYTAWMTAKAQATLDYRNTIAANKERMLVAFANLGASSPSHFAKDGVYLSNGGDISVFADGVTLKVRLSFAEAEEVASLLERLRAAPVAVAAL